MHLFIAINKHGIRTLWDMHDKHTNSFAEQQQQWWQHLHHMLLKCEQKTLAYTAHNNTMQSIDIGEVQLGLPSVAAPGFSLVNSPSITQGVAERGTHTPVVAC